MASTCAALAGCTDLSPVALEVPITRMEIPERTPRVMHLAGGGGGETYLVLSRNQVTTAPDPQHPQLDSCPHAVDNNGFFDTSNAHCSDGFFFRADAQLGDYVQLGLRRSLDELLVGQAKVYLLGPAAGHAKPGDNSLAWTIGYGGDHIKPSGRDDNTNQSGETDLSRHLIDTGIVFGHRWQPWLMGYVGAYYNHSNYSGTYTHTSGNNTTHADVDGGISLLGLNAGLKIDFGTPYVGGIVECANAHVHSGALGTSVTRCAAGIEGTFGGGRR